MKQKLAIFLDTNNQSGGAFSELVYMVEKIESLKSKDLEIIFISTSKDINLKFFKKYKFIYLKMNFFQRYVCYLRNYGSLSRRLKRYLFFENKLEKLLKKNKVDIVYFVNPSQYSLYLEDTDFMITVPDISHRENVEFPEWAKSLTSYGDRFFRTEEILSKSLIRATAVITNANIIKDKISKYYSVEKDRILVISHQPSNDISKFDEKKYKPNKSYELPGKYIFYPAMFCPHKNHKYIIDVIKILIDKHKIDISAVFCGADKGLLNDIKSYVSKKNLTKNIIFLNFVDGKDLPYLYMKSIALTMPTMSGPTNIPPWEAFKIGTPVIYSDIFNIKDVYGEAVYYINPYEPESMVEAIRKVLLDSTLRKKLIDNGKQLLDKTDFDSQVKQIVEVLERNSKIKNIWQFKE